ncbi:unnamed protein product [Amoebophrya sp. A25]|nr:unnamed protein product [Amoebophrya sp. A25]|eukprot:GSA25T00005394001.1
MPEKAGGASSSTAFDGSGSEELRDHAIEVLAKLEDFCADPSFTSAINDFFKNESEKFDSRVDDFPHEWYLSYRRYGLLLEGLLSSFDSCTSEDLHFLGDTFLRQIEDSNPLMCADYLLASLEYEDFVRVAQDHRELLFGDLPDPPGPQTNLFGSDGCESQEPHSTSGSAAVELYPGDSLRQKLERNRTLRENSGGGGSWSAESLAVEADADPQLSSSCNSLRDPGANCSLREQPNAAT